MKNQIIEIEKDNSGKIVIAEDKSEWHFNVFHYLEPMKNHIHVATITAKKFEDGFKESMMFLNKKFYIKIYGEEI